MLTTEVVANALRHGPVALENSVSVDALVFEEVVRVEVRDRGAGFEPPAPGSPGEPRTSGWGLFLVEQLARSWGTGSSPSTTVWFEVQRSERP